MEIAFEGFCLSPDPSGDLPGDLRWFVVAGSSHTIQTVISAAEIDGGPPRESQPVSCPGGEWSPGGDIFLGVGEEPEFVDGVRDPTTPSMEYPYVLAASAEGLPTQIGFAAETNSAANQWLGLGIGFTGYTKPNAILYVPDGLRHAGIDLSQAIRVIATPCYAPNFPGRTATSGEVLDALGEPYLESEETLEPGSLDRARMAACEPIETASVG